MDDRELKAFGARLIEVYEDAKKAADARLARIGENRAFHRGMQHGHVDRDGRWIPLIPKDPRISFETMPVIGPAVNVAVERRLAAWPTLDVRAPVPGIVAASQAQTMEDMSREIMSWREDVYIQHVIADYAAEIDGASFGKTFWDPFAGPLLREPAEGDSPFQGDWRFEAVSMQDAIVDPTAPSFDRIRFIAHQKTFAKLEAEERWPLDVFGESTKGKFEEIDARRRGVHDINDTRFGAGHEQNVTVRLVEHWYRPTVAYPRGLLVVTSGAMLLAIVVGADGIPTLPHGFFPWRMNYGSNLVPFSLFPDGGVARLISSQKALNHGMTRMRQALNWGSMPAWLIPTQSEIPQKSFSDIGGDAVRYRAPYKPEILQGPGVSNGHLSYVDKIRAGINDVSGQTDESRGLVNSANATGARINTVDALNARMHGSTLVLKGYFVAGMFEDAFKIMAQEYTEDRFVALRGRNAKARIAAFRKGMINPDCRFLFDPSNVMPKNKEQDLANARADFAAGAFDETPAAARFRRATNLYQEGNEIDPDSIDYQRARDQDVEFLLGAREGQVIEVAVDFADNHDIHLDIHRQTMLEPEFLALPEEIKEAYRQNHIGRHEAYRAEGMNAQIAEQNMMGGSMAETPGKGSAPAPIQEPGRPPGAAPAPEGAAP